MSTVCTQRESLSPQRASVDGLESETETLCLVLPPVADDERIELCHTFSIFGIELVHMCRASSLIRRRPST